MLNISQKNVRNQIDAPLFKSLRRIGKYQSHGVILRMLSISAFLFFVVLFLPWTQNIRSRGIVTALHPDQRPQTIHSIIAGRIEKWYVMEGDYVNKGDTILFISEVKNDYFDPRLLERTDQQLKAKGMSIESYQSKLKAIEIQLKTLKITGELQLEQTRNKKTMAELKVQSDSMDYNAAKINYDIALEQYKRMEDLYKDGLKSLTDLENRNLTMQRAQAQKISAENKLLSSRNELINAIVELSSLDAQIQNNIAKLESEKFSVLSNVYDAEAALTKLENQFSNYTIRNDMYYILAPQDGYITRAIQTGLGETIKEGEEIVSIMPSNFQLAIETYIKPIDLPLMERGQPVRIQFDGWPAIIFSGWPNASIGTYGGVVFAIDNFTTTEGLYRILVRPDPNDEPWPEALRLGAGTNGMILLKDVPIWYEMWRQVNGFPPDYYKSYTHETAKEKVKRSKE
jgi:multidrug resistance efflux pump